MPSTAASADPVVSRRRVLAGAGSLALLAVAAPACGSAPAPPEVDELEAQQELARRDSELATAAAAAVADTEPPVIAPALAQIAAERAEHAHALAAEIARVAGHREPSPTQTPEATTTAGRATPSTPAPTVSDVVNALRTAAEGAAKLATEMSGYQAGLLASIAAACTAAYTVALVARP